MKIGRRWTLALGLGLGGGLAAAQEPAVFNSEKERLGYAIGMVEANAVRKHAVHVDVEQFSRGFQDALSGAKTLMTEKEAATLVAAVQKELRKTQIALRKEELRSRGAKNRSEAQEFLSRNKARDGVITLESGLQYRVLKAADGAIPTVNDTVTVHYRGTLLDGTEFDSSHVKGVPATMVVKKAIHGWREALQMMPAGSTWQLFVPPHLAYGERAVGGKIGPNAALVFEVELLGIKQTSVEAGKRKGKSSGAKARRAARSPQSR